MAIPLEQKSYVAPPTLSDEEWRLVYWGTLLLLCKFTLGLLLTFKLWRAAEAWLEHEEHRIHVRRWYFLAAIVAVIVLYSSPLEMTGAGYIVIFSLLPLLTFLLGRGFYIESPELGIELDH